MPDEQQPADQPENPAVDFGAPAENADPQQPQLTISADESQLENIYANYFLLSATPEELAINLAFAPQMSNNIRLSHRVILNYHTAKRLTIKLQETLQRYEQTFGILEIDPAKRVKRSNS